MKLKRLCSVFLAFLMVIGNLQTSTSALENETIQVNYQSQNVSVTTDKDSALFGDSITLVVQPLWKMPVCSGKDPKMVVLRGRIF